MRPLVSPHLLAAGVLALAVLTHASDAQASRTPLFDDEGSQLGTIYLVASDVGFGGIDLVFAMIGRPMPPWLSIVELSVASVGVPAFALATGYDNTPLALAAVVSFAWFGIHAVLHLEAYPAFKRKVLAERERKRELEKERQNRQGAPTITPLSSGNGLRIRFTF